MELKSWQEDGIAYCQGMTEVLIDQRNHKIDGNVYKAIQCDMAYNSNKIEGSMLSHEQTVLIYDKGIIDGYALLDDALEVANHFSLFDQMLDDVGKPLDVETICRYQAMLLNGTKKFHDPRYSVGSLKSFDNYIGMLEIETTPASEVEDVLNKLLADYNSTNTHSFDDLLDFHVRFEEIHPLSDGNGRVGRILLLKGCLESNIMPFIITDQLRTYYIRGLSNWHEEKGWLRDTVLTAQDTFVSKCYPLAESYAQALEDDIEFSSLNSKESFKDKMARA